MNIIYIHGAKASPVAFNYIRKGLPSHVVTNIRYDCETNLHGVIDAVAKAAADLDNPAIISHSLGGVIALHVSAKISISKIVTMASPFGGSQAATMLRWMSPSPLFEQIAPDSTLMRGLRYLKLTTPTLSLITTEGAMPYMSEPNDGVVSVRSQTALVGPSYEFVKFNHNEVLLSDSVVTRIDKYLFGGNDV